MGYRIGISGNGQREDGQIGRRATEGARAYPRGLQGRAKEVQRGKLISYRILTAQRSLAGSQLGPLDNNKPESPLQRARL